MKDVHRPDLPNITNIARESAIDNSYDVLVEGAPWLEKKHNVVSSVSSTKVISESSDF